MLTILLLHLHLMMCVLLTRVRLTKRGCKRCLPNLWGDLVLLEEPFSYINWIHLVTCEDVGVRVSDQIVGEVLRLKVKRQLLYFEPVFFVYVPFLLVIVSQYLTY